MKATLLIHVNYFGTSGVAQGRTIIVNDVDTDILHQNREATKIAFMELVAAMSAGHEEYVYTSHELLNVPLLTKDKEEVYGFLYKRLEKQSNQ